MFFLFPLFYAKPGKTNIINSYWIVHLFVHGITLIQFFFLSVLDLIFRCHNSADVCHLVAIRCTLATVATRITSEV